MPFRDPENWSFTTWALVIGVGMMGGLVRWLNNLKSGSPRTFSIFEGFVEVFTSGFIALMAFYLAMSLGFNKEFALFFCGVSSHYGIRFLYKAQAIIKKQIENKYDK